MWRSTRTWIALVSLGISCLTAGVASGPAAATQSQIPYTIVNHNSWLCLGVTGASTSSGALIEQETCNGGTSQQWNIDGTKLTNVHSGLVLDVPGQSTSHGVQLEQWTSNGGTNQQFTMAWVAGYVTFTNVNSGLVLDVSGQSTSPGAAVLQWESNGGANQQWVVAPAWGTVGSVNFAGASFNSDSIATSTSKQPRWLSYPGSRFVENPVNGQYTNPTDSHLTLNEAAWVGNAYTANDLLHVALAPTGSSAAYASSTTSTWYPYKLGFTASYASPSGATISGEDYFTDAYGTTVRHMTVSAASSVDVTLTGTIPSGWSASWDSTHKALVVSGTIGDPNYNLPGASYAIQFAQGTSPVLLSEVPTISGSTWTLVKTFASGGDLDVAIGWSLPPESNTNLTAIGRANGALSAPLSTTLAAAKLNMDGLLGQVPVPSTFGVSHVNPMGVNTASVTSTDAQAGYYRAWTFLLQQTENSFADYSTYLSFPYPQVACGKASLLNDISAPVLASTCPWDSVLAEQLLAYIPTQAESTFQSLAGLLWDVQSDGSIPGEQLPSRLAETAWILYQQTGDRTTLNALYPKLKSFLLYMEANPHWGNGEPADEKDSSYVASWLHDVTYAENIASALGNSSDVTMWQSHASTELTNLRTWFFSDPNTIYNFYFVGCNCHYYGDRTVDVPDWVMTDLDIPNLPSDLATRMLLYFRQHFDSSQAAEGLGAAAYGPSNKYPDVNLTAHGLLGLTTDRTAEEFINGAVRDAVFPGDFSEAIVAGNGLTANGGVFPSDFLASEVVDFTWLQNNVRIDNGTPAAFTLDPGTASFRSGLETGEPAPTSIGTTEPTGGVSGVTGICCGLTGPETNVFTLGTGDTQVNSGTHSIIYSGLGAAGNDHAYTKVFDLSANPLLVASTTNLEYSIYPDSSANPYVYGTNSSCVAIDVVFSDGTVLRNLGATDQYGHSMDPSGQCAHLTLDHWNRVFSNIGAVAAGKHIVRIGVGYNQPSSPGGGYRGFIDDISVQ
jgi:hypothetical protein